jgi:hypothetical protein
MPGQVLPFDQEHFCPACFQPGGEPERHSAPVLIVFGKAPQWPCGGAEMQRRVQDHLCVRCAGCGYAWMETVPDGLSYAGPAGNRGGDMTIRKTGQATGQVTGVEQDGITSEAARQEWDGRDQDALDAENTAADGEPDQDDD